MRNKLGQEKELKMSTSFPTEGNTTQNAFAQAGVSFSRGEPWALNNVPLQIPQGLVFLSLEWTKLEMPNAHVVS